MKKYKIVQLINLLIILVFVSGCEEIVWPEVAKVDKTDFLGVWTAQNYREITNYTTTQDPVTFNYSTVDTTKTENVNMVFEFGVAGAPEAVDNNGVKITTTKVVDGTPQTPVVKTGYFSIGETEASDYSGKAVYINVWEKESNVHASFSNPTGEPFITYTVVKKTSTEMQLTWVSYNNTPQKSAKYSVLLKK